MFFLHGFLGSDRDFDFFPDTFQALSYFDVPLATSVPKQWDLLGHHLWDQVKGQEPISLFGYSMGGRLALAMLAAEPGRIKSLVLCSAQFRPPPNSTKRNELDHQRALSLAENPRTFLETWSTLPLFGPQDGPAWKDLKDRRVEALKTSSTIWAYLLEGFSVSVQPDFSTLIKNHAQKITFLYGERDEKYKAFADDYRTLGVQTTEIPNAWHAVHLDNPDGLLSALKKIAQRAK